MAKRGIRPDLNELCRRRIIELRHRAGWTQEKLCERASISVDAVSRIEGGSRRPSLETLGRIAWALGVAPSVLLDEANAPPPAKHSAPVLKLVSTVEDLDDAAQLGAVEIVRAYATALRRPRRS